MSKNTQMYECNEGIYAHMFAQTLHEMKSSVNILNTSSRVLLDWQ